MKRTISLALLMILFLLSACATMPAAKIDSRISDAELSASHFSILNSMSSRNTDEEKNAVISPASLNYILAMLLSGAEGNTLTEIQSFLNLSDISKYDAESIMSKSLSNFGKTGGQDGSDYILNTSNSAWISEGLKVKDPYRNKLEAKYSAEVFDNINFRNPADISRINAWVETNTEGKISNFLEPSVAESLVALCLFNTVSMKDAWQDGPLPLIPRYDFFINDHTTIKADYTGREEETTYYEGEGFVGASVPMENSDFLVFLANEENKDAILTKEIYDSLTATARTESVHILFPLFNYNNKSELDEYLMEAGIHDAFSREDADFSSIAATNKSENLYISKVLQQCYFNADENGIEAAAATAAIMRIGSGATISKNVVADRPFYFILKDRATDSVLFMGYIAVPQRDGNPIR